MTGAAKPTAEWLALSDTHTRDGRPVEPYTDELLAEANAMIAPAVVLPSTISRWLSAFLPEVAAGRMELDELLAIVDEDLVRAPMICPFCGRGYRQSQGAAWSHGTCIRCHLQRLHDAHQEKLAALEAQRDLNRLKREYSRALDEIDPSRTRKHPPYRLCDVCGDRLPSTKVNPGPTCPACVERAERHERPERMAVVRAPEDYARRVVTSELPVGTVMLTCPACGYMRPATATDAEDRCPDCRERAERRQGRRVSPAE